MKPEIVDIIESAASLAREHQDAHLMLLRLLPLRSSGRSEDIDDHAIKYALPEAIEFLRSHDKIDLAAHLESLRDSFDD